MATPTSLGTIFDNARKVYEEREATAREAENARQTKMQEAFQRYAECASRTLPASITQNYTEKGEEVRVPMFNGCLKPNIREEDPRLHTAVKSQLRDDYPGISVRSECINNPGNDRPAVSCYLYIKKP